MVAPKDGLRKQRRPWRLRWQRPLVDGDPLWQTPGSRHSWTRTLVASPGVACASDQRWQLGIPVYPIGHQMPWCLRLPDGRTSQVFSLVLRPNSQDIEQEKSKTNQTNGFPPCDTKDRNRKTATISGRKRIHKPRAVFQIHWPRGPNERELAPQIFSPANLILEKRKRTLSTPVSKSPCRRRSITYVCPAVSPEALSYRVCLCVSVCVVLKTFWSCLC